MDSSDTGSASPSGGADPRSGPLRAELQRVETRWRQLPLTVAAAQLPRLRALLDELTTAAGQDAVPDLGPGTALHQLQVLVWEAARAGRADGIREQLRQLRHDLA